MKSKIIEKVRFTNFVNKEKVVEADALIDTGATICALPKDMVEKLGLQRLRKAKVRYADNRVTEKDVYGVVTIRILNREGEFNVVCEEEGTQPLIGLTVLEQLDLMIDPSRKCVMPNPRSGDLPVVDLISHEANIY